jgi:protein-disulfide isomerase
MVSLPRRSILLSGAAVATLAIAGCNKKKDEASSTSTPASSSSTADNAASAPNSEATVDTAKLMKPGPLKDMALGKAGAPVTVIEYASLTCPHCAHFEATTFPDFKKKYVDTGKVYYIFREFPFDPRATAAFMLARCAPEEKYFPLVEVMFEQQDDWVRAADAKESLLRIAKLAGFTQESFNTCLTDQKLLDQINSSVQRATNELGVNATPTFFINGKKYSGDMSIADISAIIDPLVG